MCRMGQRMLDNVYNKRSRSAHGIELVLPWGPDPRSYDAQAAVMNAFMRRTLQMDG